MNDGNQPLNSNNDKMTDKEESNRKTKPNLQTEYSNLPYIRRLTAAALNTPIIARVLLPAFAMEFIIISYSLLKLPHIKMHDKYCASH